MDDSYSVQTTAAESTETGTLDTLQALKDGDLFLVADAWGDLKDGADGLFDHDTRILSRFVLTAGSARPSRLLRLMFAKLWRDALKRPGNFAPF